MQAKKDLVILGSYPSTEKTKQVLKACIESLKEHFDIMLCTHYPVDFEIQNMVNYYVYDYRNEMVLNEDVYIYGDSDSFYFQGYIEGSSTHPGFAIYRSIMNGLKLAKGYYDNFYYIESDAIFSSQDIQKLHSLKQDVNNNKKKGWFFELDQVLTTNIFYSDVSFFLNHFPECKDVDAYNIVCNTVGSFGVLENFLYCTAKFRNVLNEYLILKDIHFTEYFKDSKMSLTSYREDGMIYPFELRIVKVENTDKIAYVYINNNVNDSNEHIDFSINDLVSKKLPLSKTYLAEILDSNSDTFTITVGNYVKKYTRDGIFRSKSFVRFK
jgi:hypothetical protein